MYIALDVGGTHIRIAASETLENPSLHGVRKLPITNTYRDDLDMIISTIHEMTGGKEIRGIGCGFPGVFSEDKKTIRKAANLSDWVGKEFKLDIEERLKCSVSLENDETMYALGEATYGYGKGKDFVYISWGTGFGGAFVTQQNGHATVKQFEAGHHIIEWNNGKLCGCGQTGCAESYIGGGNIEKYFKKSPTDLTSEEWDDVYNYLANALINVIVFYPTLLVMLGGGIAFHQKDNIFIIEEKIRSRLKIYPMPEIRVTNLGDDVGLLGALTVIGK